MEETLKALRDFVALSVEFLPFTEIDDKLLKIIDAILSRPLLMKWLDRWLSFGEKPTEEMIGEMGGPEAFATLESTRDFLSASYRRAAYELAKSS